MACKPIVSIFPSFTLEKLLGASDITIFGFHTSKDLPFFWNIPIIRIPIKDLPWGAAPLDPLNIPERRLRAAAPWELPHPKPLARVDRPPIWVRRPPGTAGLAWFGGRWPGKATLC